jgi:hypothetical protein
VRAPSLVAAKERIPKLSAFSLRCFPPSQRTAPENPPPEQFRTVFPEPKFCQLITRADYSPVERHTSLPLDGKRLEKAPLFLNILNARRREADGEQKLVRGIEINYIEIGNWHHII